METIQYSSNENSALNNARRIYWCDRYMLGCANMRPDLISKAKYLRAIPKSRRALEAVAKRYRAKLKSKKVYRVPLLGEASIHYMYIPAFSAVNAKFRAGLAVRGFEIGEPVCVE